MTYPSPPPTRSPDLPRPPQKSNGTLWILLGVLAGFLVLCGGCLAVFSSSEDMSEPSTAPVSRPPAADRPTSTDRSPTTTRTPVFGPSDSRCADASAEVVELVQRGITPAGWKLINGIVIDWRGKTFIGGTIVDGSGKAKERADVWIIADATVYAATGGARNHTTFPKASSAPLHIGPDDPQVQAVDTCVVNRTLGRWIFFQHNTFAGEKRI
ncbi:DUF2510 domain-containing protein [Nocardia sp. NPDC050697]|uniref:DUF2510 domain-containing protein n=1 Tax=Nocardia sp. NPDC050697 TaxID=3155158 RepID=UPI0033FB6514